eukprot:5558946-Pyramimonas_sp.AAC.1
MWTDAHKALFLKELIVRVFSLMQDDTSNLFEAEVKAFMTGKKGSKPKAKAEAKADTKPKPKA